VSYLYFVNRYLGDLVIIFDTILYVNTFFTVEQCRAFLQISIWGPFVVVWSTQLIMQLRLYAMFAKSRKILCIIAPLLLAEIIGIIVVLVLFIRNMEYTNVPIPVPGLDYHMCGAVANERLLTALYVPLSCYELIMFALAIGALVKKYGAGRKDGIGRGASLNATVNMLLQSSIEYFFVYLVACAVALGMYLGLPSAYSEILNSFLTVASTIVGSRLVLNFRAYNYQPQTGDSLPFARGPASLSSGESSSNRLSSFAGTLRQGGAHGLSVSQPLKPPMDRNTWEPMSPPPESYLDMEDVDLPLSSSKAGEAV